MIYKDELNLKTGETIQILKGVNIKKGAINLVVNGFFPVYATVVYENGMKDTIESTSIDLFTKFYGESKIKSIELKATANCKAWWMVAIE